MSTSRRFAVIGSGTMGRVIAQGMLHSGKVKPAQLHVTDRARDFAEKLGRDLKVAHGTDNGPAVRKADVIVLCVKPMDVPKVLEELAASGSLTHNPLLISIAAGVRVSSIESVVGSHVPVVRAMPNTPCIIGKGVTVLAKGSSATDAHIAVAHQIFQNMGRVLELEEKHMDTVTALSASGPAFIYVVIEALSEGGVMRGLPRHVATELVAQMTAGAAEMVLATGRHPASLKDDVTTPAGCTVAGILALEDGKIRSVLARAVEIAAKAAGELGTK